MIRWVQEREAELLPIQYFHIVFTLPHKLNLLAQYNREIIYTLLFESATETLQQFAEKKWQGKLGMTCVLHTWGQQLQQHIHLHCIVTGGVLTHDSQRWINAPKNYLFKVENLGTVYRGKFCEKLDRSYQRGKINNPPDSLLAASSEHLQHLIDHLHSQPWVVYSKPPFAGPEAVLKYLSHYTHRVAISNRRIQNISTTHTTFNYKDYADDGKLKTKSFSHDEFLRRFLLHVLPKGFVRIRHFGLLAGRNRKTKLNRCRQLFNLPPQHPFKRKTILELLHELSGTDPTICPCCSQGHLHAVALTHDPPHQQSEVALACVA